MSASEYSVRNIGAGVRPACQSLQSCKQVRALSIIAELQTALQSCKQIRALSIIAELQTALQSCKQIRALSIIAELQIDPRTLQS
jgi:hypothetical protein